jgi:hypothetical protein
MDILLLQKVSENTSSNYLFSPDFKHSILYESLLFDCRNVIEHPEMEKYKRLRKVYNLFCLRLIFPVILFL